MKKILILDALDGLFFEIFPIEIIAVFLATIALMFISGKIQWRFFKFIVFAIGLTAVVKSMNFLYMTKIYDILLGVPIFISGMVLSITSLWQFLVRDSKGKGKD